MLSVERGVPAAVDGKYGVLLVSLARFRLFVFRLREKQNSIFSCSISGVTSTIDKRDSCMNSIFIVFLTIKGPLMRNGYIMQIVYTSALSSSELAFIVKTRISRSCLTSKLHFEKNLLNLSCNKITLRIFAMTQYEEVVLLDA